jgi:uncharacterized protein YhaN
MFISAFHIDGFGIYHRQGVSDLPAGLVLFTGENESGKTTLLEFFRYVLFGPERKSTKRNDYPPLAGGAHGGRLVLVRQDGRRLVVERLEKKVAVRENGGPALATEPMVSILGGVDRETFKAIFAVGLGDLQGLAMLHQGGIGGRLFAAGAGAGAAALPKALNYLKAEMADLLQPRGKARLNQWFRRLREIDGEVRVLEGQAARFAELHQERESLQATLAGQQAEVRSKERRLGRLRQLAQARQPWINLLAAREHLARLADAAEFPINGLELRDRLDREIAALGEELETHAGEARRLEEEIGRLAPDALLLGQRQAIEDLAGEAKRLEAAIQLEPEERQALGQATADLKRRLQDLGPDWDEVRLETVDTSLAVRREVQDYSRRLAQAERRLEEGQARERALAEAAANASRQAQAAADRLAAQVPPPGDAPEIWQAEQVMLRQAATLLAEGQVLAGRLEARRLGLEEAASRLAALERQLAPGGAVLPWWLAPAIFLVVAGVGGIVGFLLTERRETGWWLLGIGVAAGVALHLLRTYLGRVEGRRRGFLREEAEAIKERQHSLREEMAELERQTAMVGERLASLAAEAGRTAPASLAEVGERQTAADQALHRWRDWQTRERECRQAEEHRLEAQKLLQEAQQETARRARELERLAQDWREWLAARHFSPNLGPDGFEVVLQLVAGARAAAGQAAAAGERLKRTETYLREVRGRLGQLLERCQRRPQGAQPDLADLAALRRDLAGAVEQDRRQRELAQRLAGLRETLARLRRQLAGKEEERAHLLARAGARDDQDFERRAARHAEWRDWQKKLEASDLMLTTIAGSREAREGLEAELAAADPLDVEDEQAELTASLQHLEAALSQGEQEVGRCNLLLEQMAADQKLGDLLQERARIAEQIHQGARRWLTLAVTRHLIQSAQLVYERERQPLVMQEASQYLRVMTHGRYRLFAQVGDGGVRLEGPDARQKEEIQWSAGLADQVFFAVRLGLARELGRRAEPLPVILDDVLVKFDPRRRQGAARVILECAREQQVLFFSSHPEFEAMLRELSREPKYQGVPMGYLHLKVGKISWTPA